MRSTALLLVVVVQAWACIVRCSARMTVDAVALLPAPSTEHFAEFEAHEAPVRVKRSPEEQTNTSHWNENTTAVYDSAVTGMPDASNVSAADLAAKTDRWNSSDAAVVDAPEVTPAWRVVMRIFQLAVTVVGVALNVLTFVSLNNCRGHFSKRTFLFLRHQSYLDGLICAVATALLLQPNVWLTGLRLVDHVVCLVWHNQLVYWGTILVSAWNLVFVAVDRLIAVCFPFTHRHLTPRRIVVAFALIHAVSYACCVPAMFVVTFTAEGRCLQQPSVTGAAGDRLFYAFSIFWLLVVYLVPVAAFVGIYGRILLVFYRRGAAVAPSVSQPQTTAAAAAAAAAAAGRSVADKGFTRVTQNALTVTIAFVLTYGYDSIYFAMGNVGVTTYDFDSPTQLLGVVLANLNAVAQPVIYIFLLPGFKDAVRKTLACKFRHGGWTQTTNAASTAQSSRLPSWTEDVYC